MKNYMVITLIIGILVSLVSGIGILITPPPETPSEPEPKDGEVQIRQQGSTFYVYRYVARPGWKFEKGFNTLEEARAVQKKAEELRKEEVIIK